MNCPSCGHDTRVEETRKAQQGLRRYRRCTNCKLRFTTTEELDLSGHPVSKRDGSTVRFDRGKIAESIRKASVREVPPPELSAMVDKVVHVLIAERSSQREDIAGRSWEAPPPIPSSDIAELVMTILRNEPHYQVVLVRFALLFEAGRGTFEDAESFLAWMSDNRLTGHAEPVADEPQMVLKRDGSLQHFDRDKLRRSVRVALKKRPRADQQNQDEKFGDQVTRRILESVRFQSMVTSGQLATELLRVLHPSWRGKVLTQLTPKERQLAYLRVASTAKNYTRVEDFVQEARGLVQSTQFESDRTKR